MTLKVHMSNEKTDLINKNKNNCNFYGIAYFVYNNCI